jgi:hypothetical protein
MREPALPTQFRPTQAEGARVGSETTAQGRNLPEHARETHSRTLRSRRVCDERAGSRRGAAGSRRTCFGSRRTCFGSRRGFAGSRRADEHAAHGDRNERAAFPRQTSVPPSRRGSAGSRRADERRAWQPQRARRLRGEGLPARGEPTSAAHGNRNERAAFAARVCRLAASRRARRTSRRARRTRRLRRARRLRGEGLPARGRGYAPAPHEPTRARGSRCATSAAARGKVCPPSRRALRARRA